MGREHGSCPSQSDSDYMRRAPGVTQSSTLFYLLTTPSPHSENVAAPEDAGVIVTSSVDGDVPESQTSDKRTSQSVEKVGLLQWTFRYRPSVFSLLRLDSGASSGQSLKL